MSKINEPGVNTIEKSKKEKTLNGIYKVVHQVYSQSEKGWAKSKPIFNVKTNRNNSGDIKPLTFECEVANDYGLHLFLEHNLVTEKTEIEIVDGKPKKISYIKWIANRPSDEMYLMLWNTVHQKKKEWKPKVKTVTEPEIVFEPESSVIENVINKIIDNKPTVDVPTITDVKIDDLDGLSRDELFKTLIKDQRIIIANQLIQNTLLASIVHQNEEVYSMTKNRINQ